MVILVKMTRPSSDGNVLVGFVRGHFGDVMAHLTVQGVGTRGDGGRWAPSGYGHCCASETAPLICLSEMARARGQYLVPGSLNFDPQDVHSTYSKHTSCKETGVCRHIHL